MAILKRPMFRKGGSANEGIMHGLERRGYADSNWEDLTSQRRGYYGPPQRQTPITFEDFQGSFKGGTGVSQNILDVLIKKEGTEDVYGVPLRDFKPKVKTAQEIALEKDAESKQTLKEIAKEKIWKEAFKKDKIPPPPEKIIEKIIAKNESLDDKTKRYLKMMAPHMQERMIADALGAASAAFGKGTGNTGQTIANAISAAAAGMGGTKDIYDKVKMLTLQGEIQKDIEKSKPYKLNATETLIALGKSTDPEDKALFNTLAKGKDVDTSVILELYNKEQGSNKLGKATGNLYKIKANSANIETYGGDLPVIYNSKTKQEEESFEKMEEGKEYYNYLDGNFYKLDEKGEPVVIKKPDYLK